MSASSTSIFVSRLRRLPVLDTAGDKLGIVRDVVVQVRSAGRAPRAKGLVVELFAQHRVFVPMVRVRTISALQVTISGVLNTRRFERRDSEILIQQDLLDSPVRRRGADKPSWVYDVSIRQARSHDWEIDEVALRSSSGPFARRTYDTIVDWSDVDVFVVGAGRSTREVLARMEDMKPADVARELHDMTPERREEIAAALDDESLADALEELPEDVQVELIQALEVERAADILEEMNPDDAADLVAELTPEVAEQLLDRMEPEEAQDVRRLMRYDEFTAGGLMTPEPIILAHDDTVATALARVRAEDITPALAAMVYVCRSPLEAPTGRFLGAVHIQRLLREPPSLYVSGLVDSDLEPLKPGAHISTVSRYFATYNLVCAPVVNEDRQLLGAVTVDDVLDAMLPDDWRGDQMDGLAPSEAHWAADRVARDLELRRSRSAGKGTTDGR
ncbi:magnesium transporter MgtE N-terminal domain-containing protein [Raineyella sp. LH-20]|uniref:magnesium transporter MgtE N-terminal domain-containing protein n=1 Tax=Raineyella sp. LH-20 TaxID=3081204 RepID=UPI003985A942